MVCLINDYEHAIVHWHRMASDPAQALQRDERTVDARASECTLPAVAQGGWSDHYYARILFGDAESHVSLAQPRRVREKGTAASLEYFREPTHRLLLMRTQNDLAEGHLPARWAEHFCRDRSPSGGEELRMALLGLVRRTDAATKVLRGPECHAENHVRR